MKRAIVIMALLLPLVSVSAQRQPSPPGACSQSEVTRTAAQVDSARKRLLALPIGIGLQPDVSPVAQQTIAETKDALGDFINAYLRCVSRQADAPTIQKELSALGHAFALPPGQFFPEDQIPADLGKFGFELYFDVRMFESPRLIGVTAKFSIECGGDTVLLMFAPDNDSWKEVLRWQKKAYATVDGGTLGFDYGVSPPDDAGQWFVVTHEVAPWCSSTWSSIRYSVLKPTAEPLRPRVVFSGAEEMWWGNEDFGVLTVQKDAFDLRFHSSSIDAGVHNRVWVRHYSVIGDTIQQTQPVAVSPRDFVDEWIVSPWQQAEQWSSKSAVGELRQAHEGWFRREKFDNSLLEYYSVNRCADSHDHYQVEIGEETGPNFETARCFYFQVSGNGAYTMLRVSEKPDPRCSGPDILDEMSTK